MADQHMQSNHSSLAGGNHGPDHFLADVSHEIRGPLNAIVGFSELLQDEAFGELNGEQQEAVSDILHAAQHLLRLMNDVLDISRVEAGQLDLDPQVLSVACLVEDTLNIARGMALERAVELEAEVDPRLAVWGDESRVMQLLYNLISNAIKYSDANSQVRLSAAREGDYVAISVSDHGCGIAPEDQQRIFEDFVVVRGRCEGESRSPGAGLGLAVSRRLVASMGGEIACHSVPGDGSTFTFTLPAREAPHCV